MGFFYACGVMSKLIVNFGYYALQPEQKAEICNGAGAKNDWKSAFISNNIYGLDCTEVFNIHDYAYHYGITAGDKRKADTEMLINLMTLINEYGGWLMSLRRYRAMTYYNAVVECGNDAFFTKNK